MSRQSRPALLEAAHEEDVGRPVAPALDRLDALVAGQVHAVGDELVVAREVAVDEVARRGADGDAPVEASGVAAQEAAAELVARTPAGVGVEGGHVDAARLAQQEQREQRHERLVEVEHVEAFALEQGADLREVAGRDGECPHRPVGGHAEAPSEADDVSLAGPLEAVRAADDAHVVTALDEPFVEVSDVLVDTAGQRVDVGRDEADLHPGRSRSPISRSSKRGGLCRPPG